MCPILLLLSSPFFFFFFKHTSPTEISTLSLHDALPISLLLDGGAFRLRAHVRGQAGAVGLAEGIDRKSTRLNSSHRCISYAVFCLKKKKTKKRSQAHEDRNLDAVENE